MARATLQLQTPPFLAELTGIRVVADFRSRDVAAGARAPLVSCIPPRCFPRARPDRAGAEHWRHLQHQRATSAAVIGDRLLIAAPAMCSWTTGATSTLAHPTMLNTAGRPRALCTRPCWKSFLESRSSESATESTGRDLFNVAVQQQVAALCGTAPRRCTSHFDRADCPGLREHSQTIRWRRNFDGSVRWRRAQQPPDAPPKGLVGPLPVGANGCWSCL